LAREAAGHDGGARADEAQEGHRVPAKGQGPATTSGCGKGWQEEKENAS